MGRMSVRQLWAAKLAGADVSGAARVAPQKLSAAPAVLPVRVPFAGVVLGIDPSLRGTGLALVEFAAGRQPLLLRSRTVKVAAREPMPVALAEIHRAVTEFLASMQVRHVALEQTIYVQNFQTAQILGAARGAAMTAAALHELPVFEYAPLRVKQAVVGQQGAGGPHRDGAAGAWSHPRARRV